VGFAADLRVAGTGIFLSPGTAFIGTQNVGVSLLFWIFGAINAIAVSYLYIEFGLNIPRYDRTPVPRNGGELNYVRYNNNQIAQLSIGFLR
jgi:hypothetical protein